MLNSPLIEVDAQRKINEIQEKYLELKKGLNKLNEISEIPDNKLISELDGYKRLKHTLKNDFNFLDRVIDEFNSNLEDDSQTYYSTNTRKEIKEVLSKIDMNKLKNQNEEYKRIVEKIDKRMYKYIKIEEERNIEREYKLCLKQIIKMKTQISNLEKGISTDIQEEINNLKSLIMQKEEQIN